MANGRKDDSFLFPKYLELLNELLDFCVSYPAPVCRDGLRWRVGVQTDSTEPGLAEPVPLSPQTLCTAAPH